MASKGAQLFGLRMDRGVWIKERQRQTGCLAIEASREWAERHPTDARLLETLQRETSTLGTTCGHPRGSGFCSDCEVAS